MLGEAFGGVVNRGCGLAALNDGVDVHQTMRRSIITNLGLQCLRWWGLEGVIVPIGEVDWVEVGLVEDVDW